MTHRSLIALTGTLLLTSCGLIDSTPTGPLPHYEMIAILPGTFMMGSPPSEVGRLQNETQHSVTISKGFQVGKYEVTQTLWTAVMGSNPAAGQSIQNHPYESGGHPAVYIRWCDAVIFANEFSRREGLTPAYQLPSGFKVSMSDDQCEERSEDVGWDRSANGYRLLTEAEWEYVARAGTTHRYAGVSRDSDMCRYGNISTPAVQSELGLTWVDTFPCEDRLLALAPIGVFEPNAWGVYDMTGNVNEWCWDRSGGDYDPLDSFDPAGPANDREIITRVLRGGSWSTGPNFSRVAARNGCSVACAGPFTGFRLARSL